MADQIQIADVLRRALDANVQYFTTLSRLASECLQALGGSLVNLSSEPRADKASTEGRGPATAMTSVTEATPISTIVLEAEAGGHALGVFLVENGLPRDVVAPIEISALIDSSGREVRPLIKFEPEVMRLQPREQILVRVMVKIEEDLEPGVRYLGEISVPALPGTRVPFVLRRRPTVPGTAAPIAPTTSEGARRPQAKPKNRTRSQNPKLPRGRSRKTS